MQYLGGKARIAKHVASVLRGARKPGQLYVEPFVGAANVFTLMELPKFGYDANRYIVATLTAVAGGWYPPSTVSEALYRDVKLSLGTGKYDDAMTGFVGFGCSFGGKFFGGYARSGRRSFAQSALDSLERKRKGLAGSAIADCDYREIFIPSGSLVYCDPPYAGTTGYGSEFDSEEFWTWAQMLASAHGCDVYVSEYTAPPGVAEEVWRKETYTVLSSRVGYSEVRTERLFRVLPL